MPPFCEVHQCFFTVEIVPNGLAFMRRMFCARCENAKMAAERNAKAAGRLPDGEAGS